MASYLLCKINKHAEKMMMHHQWMCHSKVSCVRVRFKIAYYSWNINSAQSCNCEDAVYCTHIVCIPYCVLHLKWNVFIVIPLCLYLCDTKPHICTKTHCEPDWTNLESMPESSSWQPIQIKNHQFIHHFFLLAHSQSQILSILTQWIFT